MKIFCIFRCVMVCIAEVCALCSAIILHSYEIRGQSEQRYNTSYKLIVIQIMATMSCNGIENGTQKYCI